MFSILYRLPGHAWVLQVVFSALDPSQSSPPWDGGGLSHCLVLLFSPDPQVLVHSPYSLQSPHVPFTKPLIEYTKWFKRHLFIWSIIRNTFIWKFKMRLIWDFATWTGIDIACCFVGLYVRIGSYATPTSTWLGWSVTCSGLILFAWATSLTAISIIGPFSPISID